MTSTTPTIPTPEAPTLSASICGLLDLLRSGRREGVLEITGRTPSGIDRGLRLSLRADQIDHEFIPPAVLQALEDGCWALHVGAPVYASGMSADVSRLGLLPARWTFHPAYERGRGVAIPPDRLAAAQAAIAGFAFEPTMTISGGSPTGGAGYTLTAIFALTAPLDVRTAGGETRALDLLRGLARALESDLPADDLRLRDVVLPVPGSVIREGAGLDVVTCPVFDPTHRYSVEQIEAAITPTTSETPRSRRVRRQEVSAS